MWPVPRPVRGESPRGGDVLKFAQTRWYELSPAHKKAPRLLVECGYDNGVLAL